VTLPAELDEPLEALDALADVMEASTAQHAEKRELIEAQLLRRQAQAGMLAETLGECQ